GLSCLRVQASELHACRCAGRARRLSVGGAIRLCQSGNRVVASVRQRAVDGDSRRIRNGVRADRRRVRSGVAGGRLLAAHATLAAVARLGNRSPRAVPPRRPGQTVQPGQRRATAGDVTISEPILGARALTRRFGGLVANDAVTLELSLGELHALLGPNGAGKSTFINLLS